MNDGKAISKYVLIISCALEWISGRLFQDGLDNEEPISDRFLDYMIGIRENVQKILGDDKLSAGAFIQFVRLQYFH